MSLLISDPESSSSSLTSPQNPTPAPTSPKQSTHVNTQEKLEESQESPGPKQSLETKLQKVELNDTSKEQLVEKTPSQSEDQVWRPRQTQQKVPIRLQAIGSTAAIQPSSFSVSGNQNIASIAKYIMKKLRLKTVHVYVQSSFEPTPEESLGDLYESFKTNNVLNLSYCESIAFG